MNEVRIDVFEDETRPSGHACILFSEGIGGSNSQLNLAITRKSTDRPYLGSDGWQARPTVVAADVVDRGGSRTALVVGPSICSWIPVDLQVRIEAQGQDVWGSVFWPAVTPSLERWQPGLSMPIPPEPEPIVVEAPLPVPPPITAPRLSEIQPPTIKRKSRLIPFLAVLMLLFAVGGLVAYNQGLFDNVIGPRETLAQRLERLKQSDSDGHELLVLSSDAYAVNNREIGWSAINLSIERGSQPAKLQLGAWYDPRTFDSKKLASPDANLAARYYFELWKGSDNNDALKQLKALCAESANSASPFTSHFQGFKADFYCVSISQ